jgi:hypothetical protein
MKNLSLFFATAMVLLSGNPVSADLGDSRIVPDTLVVIRAMERGPQTPDADAIESSFSKARAELLAQPGYLSSTLYQEAFPGSPYPFITLTSWASAQQMGEASPDLAPLAEGGVLMGQYRVADVSGEGGRPEVGSVAILAAFEAGPDPDQVAEAVRAFDDAASRAEGWLGSLAFESSGGEPRFGLVSLSSWASLEDVQRFLGSGPMVNQIIRAAQAGMIAPSGLSILRLVRR